MTIQDLCDEFRAKGLEGPLTDQWLRATFSLPTWVAIPPAFLTLCNEHLGTVEMPPEDDSQDGTGEDIFSLFLGVLGNK